MHKRTLIKVAVAGAAALMLTACGKDEPKQAEPAPAAAPAKTEASGPLKVAFVYVSPANEEGWSAQHDKGRQAIEAKFGDKIKVTWVESFPKTPTPNA